MLFLALSSLQGRPITSAFDELRALGPVGIQLTPGNQPSANFDPGSVATRTHHGFALGKWKTKVWSDDGRCLVKNDSVHPPMGADLAWWEHASSAPILETMYPGYALGCGEELERAMTERLPLAVDVSHVFIQRHAGVISEATWRHLQDYERVEEVHVSKNPGTTDAHQPLTEDTFGLGWAREKLRAGTPVILEAYLHRLTRDARRAQLDLLLGDL